MIAKEPGNPVPILIRIGGQSHQVRYPFDAAEIAAICSACNGVAEAGSILDAETAVEIHGLHVMVASYIEALNSAARG